MEYSKLITKSDRLNPKANSILKCYDMKVSRIKGGVDYGVYDKLNLISINRFPDRAIHYAFKYIVAKTTGKDLSDITNADILSVVSELKA